MMPNEIATLPMSAEPGFVLSVVLEQVLTAKQSAQRQTAVTMDSRIFIHYTSFARLIKQVSFFCIANIIIFPIFASSDERKGGGK